MHLKFIKIYFREQSGKEIVEGWTVVPQEPLNVIIYGKKNFEDIIKGFEMQKLFCIIEWVWSNHKGPYKKEAGNQSK